MTKNELTVCGEKQNTRILCLYLFVEIVMENKCYLFLSCVKFGCCIRSWLVLKENTTSFFLLISMITWIRHEFRLFSHRLGIHSKSGQRTAPHREDNKNIPDKMGCPWHNAGFHRSRTLSWSDVVCFLAVVQGHE